MLDSSFSKTDFTIRIKKLIAEVCLKPAKKAMVIERAFTPTWSVVVPPPVVVFELLMVANPA